MTAQRAKTMTRPANRLELDKHDEWRDYAACFGKASADYDPWHPDGKTGPSFRDAKKICAECPVIAQCLAYALSIEGTVTDWSREGVWGGKSPKERYEISQRMRNLGTTL